MRHMVVGLIGPQQMSKHMVAGLIESSYKIPYCRRTKMVAII